MAGLDVTALLGRMAAEKAALLEKLRVEGLLEENRSRAVPPVAVRIGLVASPDTEGYRDFLGQLTSSPYGFRVEVARASVQGSGAPRSIARAISRSAASGCDLVVVVRGGGSKADLVAFDSEPVARAIAVVSGGGVDRDRPHRRRVGRRRRRQPLLRHPDRVRTRARRPPRRLVAAERGRSGLGDRPSGAAPDRGGRPPPRVVPGPSVGHRPPAGGAGTASAWGPGWPPSPAPRPARWTRPSARGVHPGREARPRRAPGGRGGRTAWRGLAAPARRLRCRAAARTRLHLDHGRRGQDPPLGVGARRAARCWSPVSPTAPDDRSCPVATAATS